MIEKLQMMFFMLSNDLTAKRDERGATAVEYGLLVAFIAIALIAAATLFGGALSGFFNRMTAEVNTWVVP